MLPTSLSTLTGFRIQAPNPLHPTRRQTPRNRAVIQIRAVAAAAPAHTTTLYDELGLHVGATGSEIKAAYRRLARERHPDVAPQQEEGDFIRLHDAYATLSDPDKRAEYDRAMRLAGGPHLRAARARSPSRRTWETDQCW